MNDYVPTLDDVATLLDTHPQYFSSPLQASRSLANATNAYNSGLDTGLNDALYADYTGNGGPAIGPNGEMPAPEVTSDQVHGEPGCDCEAATPCCIKEIKFSCSHGSTRMKLPLEDPDKECRLVLVTDKDPRPGNDKLKIELDRVATPGCSMPGSMPLLSISGWGNDVSQRGEKLEHDISHGEQEGVGGTDLSKFVAVTGKTLFGNIEDVGKELSFEVQSCAGVGAYASIIQTFPKVEWEATAFSYEVSCDFKSNLTFQPKVKLEGSLEGTYGASTFTIQGSGEFGPDPQNHTGSMLPFLDGTLDRLRRLTGGNVAADDSTLVEQVVDAATDNSGLSKIGLRHKFSLGPAKFKLAEHPNDHSKVGVEAEVAIGFDPVFGITVKLDIIDVVLRIASGGAPQLADAIAKARAAAAEGFGDDDSFAEASAKVDISVRIDGDIGKDTGVTIKRAVGSDVWEGSGRAGGEIGIEFRAELAAEGRVWLLQGAASARGTASSKITGEVKTLTPSESANAQNAKFNAKIEWDGMTMAYRAEARLSIFGARATTGNLTIFGKRDLCNVNF